MNLVIFGPPGAGKGTQSKFIVEKFNMFQLSTGEFLRKEISDNTTLGKKISLVISFGTFTGSSHCCKVFNKRSKSASVVSPSNPEAEIARIITTEIASPDSYTHLTLPTTHYV